MRLLESRVASAIANAEPLENSAILDAPVGVMYTPSGLEVPVTPAPTAPERAEQLRTPIALQIGPLQPNEVALPKASDFAPALLETHRQLQLPYGRSRGYHTSRHEATHFAAAARQGLHAEGRIRYYRGGRDGSEIIACPSTVADGTVPYLGYFAIIGAPRDRSPGDKADIDAAGLTDTAAFRHLVAEYNQASPTTAPIPMPPSALRSYMYRAIHTALEGYIDIGDAITLAQHRARNAREYGNSYTPNSHQPSCAD